MGQASNSGRNASLDDKKERAAGRMDEVKGPLQGNSDDFDNFAKPESGTVGGAFGATRKPARKSDQRGSNLSEGGGGGGGGGPSTAKDEQGA